MKGAWLHNKIGQNIERKIGISLLTCVKEEQKLRFKSKVCCCIVVSVGQVERKKIWWAPGIIDPQVGLTKIEGHFSRPMSKLIAVVPTLRSSMLRYVVTFRHTGGKTWETGRDLDWRNSPSLIFLYNFCTLRNFIIKKECGKLTICNLQADSHVSTSKPPKYRSQTCPAVQWLQTTTCTEMNDWLIMGKVSDLEAVRLQSDSSLEHCMLGCHVVACIHLSDI